ncbi:hypothetical protein RHSIM_Rhsim10G0037500 [Rhododendron simsii]|uniref:Uncharacterized protein n=1 Tax=Rhododendron simsii TaxID=118357 RepID=A0A834G930_RHOSS|nr:hypothetical protein RHSIM_Rhsim10G0037500 [Rhododendron simsii]
MVNFLPTSTLLTFETLVPTFYRSGAACDRVTTLMLTALLTLCALSCFFFHFTDSFSVGGRVYCGFITPWGLVAFNPGIDEPKDPKYKLGVADVVHAVMSALVFLAIAFSDRRVSGCLYPGHEKEIDEVMSQGFLLIIGIVCSALFLVFHKDRHGIGFLEAPAA